MVTISLSEYKPETLVTFKGLCSKYEELLHHLIKFGNKFERAQAGLVLAIGTGQSNEVFQVSDQSLPVSRFGKNTSSEKITLADYDYPSRNNIENIFSKLLQKERNIAFQYRNVNIRRNLMIRILETYYNKEFSYDEVKIKLNDRYGDEGFFQHFEYLVTNNFIEKTTNTHFKFCDRVKKWKNFGQI